MYVIFINDAEIYLIDQLDKKDKSNFYKYTDICINDILKKLESKYLDTVYLYHNDLEFLWKKFKSNFKIVEAAGGLIYNEKGETLWIYRNDKWDLPKGKIEKGESKETAAIREVEEECGITDIHLKKYLSTTYHTYTFKEKNILKVTYWYEMLTSSKQKLTPQLAEDITKVAWINNVKVKDLLANTYGNIKLLCKFAFLLKKKGRK